jgi:hypothetical protein
MCQSRASFPFGARSIADGMETVSERRPCLPASDSGSTPMHREESSRGYDTDPHCLSLDRRERDASLCLPPQMKVAGRNRFDDSGQRSANTASKRKRQWKRPEPTSTWKFLARRMTETASEPMINENGGFFRAAVIRTDVRPEWCYSSPSSPDTQGVRLSIPMLVRHDNPNGLRTGSRLSSRSPKHLA